MENSLRNNAADRSPICYTRIDRSSLLCLLRARSEFNPVFGTTVISKGGPRC